MAEGGIVAPLPASDVDDDDPFEDAPQRTETATTDTNWMGMFGAGAAGDVTFVPQVPSSAFDYKPPTINGQALSSAKMAHFVMQRELDRAAEPLLKQLGPSFEQLSRFGYSKPNLDPGAEQLQTIVRKLVRNF